VSAPSAPNQSVVTDFAGFALAAERPAIAPASSCRPVIFRLAADDASRFVAFCETHGIHRHDKIDRQLRDLAAVRLPAASDADRRRFVADTSASHEHPAAIGNWAYLPWTATVVHLLDRDDFFDVITDRNRDKISREQQLRLRAKRIGVIGLSVGGEAAVTVAQEHLCGSIVLADFDSLDLSNLNRLNAGIADLGLNKAVIVARRVLEIDPYLDVTIFEDGVTDANVASFLDGLDLLVEECDGLRMKFTIRQLAQERGLNIVFAGDERGFISIEPHGHTPDLPIFHGRITEPPLPREEYATPLDFMKALAEWLGGWDQISDVSRRSLEQLGTTLCGYPQLAGEARYAAGQVAHVARRLLLGERIPPFIGHLDLDRLIPSGPASE
jgi:molybdopterin/thiamine biosynthesis adenylyltransferase